MSVNDDILAAVDRLEKASAANTRAMNSAADAINASITTAMEAQALEKEIIRDLAGTIRQWANVMKPATTGNSVTTAGDKEVLVGKSTTTEVTTYELSQEDIEGYTKHVIDITFEKIKQQRMIDTKNRYKKDLRAIDEYFNKLREHEDDNLFKQAMTDFYEEDEDDE